MNKKVLGAALGFAVLALSTAASACDDVPVGVGISGPVYARPVAVAYGGYDDWRAREWRERREWREHEWRERARWGGY
ncbi:hypothetical protein FAZ95_03295 [Trinickia violacea]|uniref:Uncharacterized protein n=1 Tax=Trinickia violacea TaxID=2571746 RepID=A0A4P8IN65_9BURK|nr:hypothetical protein [Trinickia violacea]QCP48294.1 hypothetical protein FAZ95_03295 [Trinickia violacea]